MKVGLLWRVEWDPAVAGRAIPETCRLRGVFAAFAALGVAAEPVVYSDEGAESVRKQLLGLDGVLVWVNPVEQSRDRSRLDPLLRQVAEEGVWVSAHPDVIQKMATKQVLADTAAMTWSASTHVYRSSGQLRDELPARLSGGPLVLKQQRGMGGTGVWKVEHLEPGAVLVQHAAGGAAPERMSLEEFVERCSPYFERGVVVEQPYQSRLDEGMIRVYLSHDRVVGFAHQYPRGLLAPGVERPDGKTFELASEPRYGALRERMENEWLGELQRIVGIDTFSLPVIWDADFLYGPKTEAGEDTYVLCEINASSTFAFPEHAMPTVARAALERVTQT
jgi:hypothetical protein